MAVRLREMYKADVVPALQKKFNYKSVMQIPKIDKVIINVGCGEAKTTQKLLTQLSATLQKSQVRNQLSALLRNQLLTSSFVKV